MICSVHTATLNGIQGNHIAVECYISNGLPGFDIVGLPDAAVKEARERVRAAAKVSGLRFPTSRITVNLAPASLKKVGTHYDLPILVSILAIVLGGLGIVLTRPLLNMINVPENVIPDAMTYMRIVLAGALASGLYNMSSSLLRAMGDSVTPLVFLIISSILNVLLNLLFVAKFGMEVSGVAIATIIATAISAVLCMIYGWR